MDFGIRNKVALVAGGSKGIGCAVATMLAAEGCKVAIVARDRGAIDATVGALRAGGAIAFGYSCDLTTEDGIWAALAGITAELGAPDIAISQVTCPIFGRFMDIPPADYVRLFDAFTGGLIRLARAVLPEMQRKKWGRIVHIGSVVAKEPERLIPHMGHNTVQSSAVTLLKGLSDEFAGDGITVNGVGPGFCKTDGMVSVMSEAMGVEPDQIDAVLAASHNIPAGRASTPEEIAAVIAFLCSAQASYLTGEWIAVDGGKHRAAF